MKARRRLAEGDDDEAERRVKASRCTTDAESGGRDSISELPDEILCSIISELSLRDIVRATLVCRRWRALATSSLLQSDELLFDCVNVLGLEHPSCCYGGRSSPAKKEKFVAGVDQFLRFFVRSVQSTNTWNLHRKTTVSSFTVDFCLGSDFSRQVDRWIDYAVRFLGVHSLHIVLRCENAWPCVGALEADQAVVIGGKLFDSKLSHLRMAACKLEPNLFGHQQRFGSSLTKLYLLKIQLATYDMESMFRCLVHIETLGFDKCSLPQNLLLGSLSTLRHFCVYACVNLKKVTTFNNMELTKFVCVGRHLDFNWDLSGAPKLEELMVYVNARQFGPLFARGLNIPAMLRKLAIGTFSDSVHSIEWFPDFIPIYGGIKSLRLFLWIHKKKFNLLKLISVVKALPNLHALQLMVKLQEMEEDHEQEGVEVGDFVIRHLEKVQICTSYFTTNLHQLAIYLLKHAIALKKLVLEKFSIPAPKVCSWHEQELHKISVCRELNRDVDVVVSMHPYKAPIRRGT